MNQSSLKRVFPSRKVDMGGIPVLQPFPTSTVEQIDPFLLLHHSKIKAREGSHPLQAGIGPHPHRGFAPVTYVIEGALHHRDSLGNSSIISEGGAQWLVAGRGIIHSERPSRELAESGGHVEVVQIWINLTRKNKMDAPNYVGLEKNDLTKLSLGSELNLELIAGGYGDEKGKVNPPFPLLFGALSGKGSGVLEVPPNMEGGIYVIRGNGKISGHGLMEEKNFYHLESKVQSVDLDVEDEFLALVMLGQPIKESLATYGPFVMNNQTEIMEAMRDYNQGRMGILIEE